MYARQKSIANLTGIRHFMLVFTTVWLAGCQPSTDMADFYFPLDKLENGLVYVYESQSSPKTVDDVWYYKTLQRGDDRFLAGQSYSQDGRVNQLVVEKETTLGMLTDSLFLYLPDSSNRDRRLAVRIFDRATYPFYINKEEALDYRIQWSDPRDSLEYTLIRSRRLMGDTTLNVLGQPCPGVVFVVDEQLETFWPHDGATTSEWTGIEVYGRGLGLVYYKKVISPELTREYLLSDTLSMASFLSN